MHSHWQFMKRPPLLRCAVALSLLSVGVASAWASSGDCAQVGAGLRQDVSLQAMIGEALSCQSAEVVGSRVTVVLDLPADVRSRLDDPLSDAIVQAVVHAFADRAELEVFDIRAMNESGVAVPLSDLISGSAASAFPAASADDTSAVQSSVATTGLTGQPPVTGQGQPTGALTGKTVYLSAGHGWYYDDDNAAWLTQRPNTYGICEDFSNVELVSQYLVQYLENAGADVWTCRDRCLSTVEVIVDNTSAAFAGSWATVSGGYNGNYRYALTASTQTATATFTPNIPVSGYYPLYVYYVKGSDRPTDALIRVNHTGGTTEVRVNQQLTRSAWRYIGTYYWFAGTAQSVTVSNQSATSSLKVIADAIRIGGGVGDQSPNPPNSNLPGSGKRRADECSVYWAKYQGASSSVYNPTGSGDGTDDVTVRPLYAEWENESGEQAVYVSVHSNAYNGSITGTETYMYLDGTPAGSTTLRNYIHNEVVGDLRLDWDPDWVDRGVKTANFGELRLLSVIPGCLVETAFHDNVDDASNLREPEFRRIVARAIYQGIAKHFGGTSVVLLPEPPTHARVSSSGSPTSVTVSWRAPTSGGAAGGSATKYKVYRSPNGFAFDNGTEATSTSLVVGGLSPGALAYFRVSALNSGGESFPTAVLACKTSAVAGDVPMLIVDGYDALDQTMDIPVYEGSALGTVQRQFLDRRMNSYDYMHEHASAVAVSALSPAFDSASNEAVADGDVNLLGYRIIDWYTGRENYGTEPISAAEQSAIVDFMGTGGRLLVSGMDVAQVLAAGTSSDQNFLQNTLKATFLGSSAGVYSVNAVAGGAFDGLGTVHFDDGTHGTYNVSSADVISPYSPAVSALSYGASTAGVQHVTGSQVVFLGFPFETIYTMTERDAVMDRILGYFDACSVTVYGDFDGDGDVDQADYGFLQACLTGPANPIVDSACCKACYDGDTDVDAAEFNAFQNCFTGPGIAADPNCD